MRYFGIMRYIKLKLISGFWDNFMNIWLVEFI